MAFLVDNCVWSEKLPFCAQSLDYSSELNLFAVLEDETVFVWNPETEKTRARFEVGWDMVTDVLFLPDNHIATAGGDKDSCGIKVFSLNEKGAVLLIGEHDMDRTDPGHLALTPDKNLLVSDLANAGISEIRLDLENMKVLGCKEIWNVEDAQESGTEMLCCSSNNYTVCCSAFDDYSFACVDVGFSSDGEVSLTNKQTISFCMINGEKRSFGEVRNLAHGDEHVIVATGRDIVVLESAREGSPAHVIVSSEFPHRLDYPKYGQIQLNNKNQLMICDGGKVIKIYDYKRPNCLQGLCRYQINKSLKQNNKKNVEHLPIPKSLKDYLSYEV